MRSKNYSLISVNLYLSIGKKRAEERVTASVATFGFSFPARISKTPAQKIRAGVGEGNA